MCRVGKLNDQHRSGSILEAESETNNTTCYTEHDQAIGKGLKEDANDDDDGSDDDGEFSTDAFD